MEDESEVKQPLIGLPEEETVFASSETSLITPSDSPVSVQAKALAILILLAASMGFLNGLDYSIQDKGLVRPHEFIYRFSEQAPPALQFLMAGLLMLKAHLLRSILLS